jgi:hypothetical protein
MSCRRRRRHLSISHPPFQSNAYGKNKRYASCCNNNANQEKRYFSHMMI